jgi:hypothetical protein
MRRSASITGVWFCPTCGLCCAAWDAPLCRHYVPDPDRPPTRMVPVPEWHPMHPNKDWSDAA